MEVVAKTESGTEADTAQTVQPSGRMPKLTSAKLAEKHGMKTKDLMDRLVAKGLLELRDTLHYMTDMGRSAGGEFRKGASGFYFLWPEDLSV